jgi:two-component system CheB/CheR fusion protein
LVREGLLFELRNAISRAKKENAPVGKQNVQMKSDNGNGNKGGPTSSGDHIRLVNLEVSPVHVGNVKELYFMVVFQDVEAEPSLKARGRRENRESQREITRFTKLEQELAATKEYLQSVIETQEATNEELQSANEEILSSNEELQSTNEELETAKEELQSANEELTTVNDELRGRNMEITQINNDLTNLLDSIDVALIIVGNDLAIRRFNPKAEKLIGLIPADVGRPFVNINPNIDLGDFKKSVLDGAVVPTADLQN